MNKALRTSQNSQLVPGGLASESVRDLSIINEGRKDNKSNFLNDTQILKTQSTVHVNQPQYFDVYNIAQGVTNVEAVPKSQMSDSTMRNFSKKFIQRKKVTSPKDEYDEKVSKFSTKKFSQQRFMNFPEIDYESARSSLYTNDQLMQPKHVPKQVIIKNSSVKFGSGFNARTIGQTRNRKQTQAVQEGSSLCQTAEIFSTMKEEEKQKVVGEVYDLFPKDVADKMKQRKENKSQANQIKSLISDIYKKEKLYLKNIPGKSDILQCNSYLFDLSRSHSLVVNKQKDPPTKKLPDLTLKLQPKKN